MAIQVNIKKRDWTVHPKASSTQPLIPLKHTLSELTGPVFGHNAVKKIEADLTKNAAKKGKEAIGERMVITGRVTDEAGRPIPGTLVEIWQTNAAGLTVIKAINTMPQLIRISSAPGVALRTKRVVTNF